MSFVSRISHIGGLCLGWRWRSCCRNGGSPRIKYIRSRRHWKLLAATATTTTCTTMAISIFAFSFFTRVAAYRSRSCSLSWCCPENNSNFYFVPNKSMYVSVRVYSPLLCARWTGGKWSKLRKHITYIYGRREEEDWQGKPHTHTHTHLQATANVYIDKRRWLWIFLPSRNVTEAVCGLVWARSARALVKRESKRMMRLDIGNCHTSGVNVLWARCADAGLMCAQSF